MSIIFCRVGPFAACRTQTQGTRRRRAGSERRALEALVAACVRQQLLRPGLAHLLDLEEARPPFRGASADSGTLYEVLASILARQDLQPQPRPDIAIADLLAIVRGMTDAAGERGETGVEDLQGRIERAVFGYLGLAKESSGEAGEDANAS